jgi:CHAT domain-containing protein
MDKARQQAYLELVQALLECEGGTEKDILQAHPDLVDEGLVMALLVVAQSMEEYDPENASTIAWLIDYASQLAQALGLDIELISAGEECQSEFLSTVFEAMKASDFNPEVIYPILRDNLSLLDESLIPLLTSWPRSKFAELDEVNRQFLIYCIVRFANLIEKFSLGSRLANLEIAIACYHLALEVYTRDAYPEQWAGNQMNLAFAYSNRIRGERATNLEESIERYKLALEVLRSEAYPELWAMTQSNMGLAYDNRIRGEKAVNLEKSIECYQFSLKVYTHETYPEDWARNQMNLANAYRDRICGERAANLEKSIELYKLALKIYTHQAYPEDWAMTQMNLGGSYLYRIRGNRAANLEEAIVCLKFALKVYTHEAYPEMWAMTQNNLAGAYIEQIREGLAVNYDEAIACFHSALKVYTREAYPEGWAMTQNNLAVVCVEQSQWELAIDYYELALQVYTHEAYPESWARTQYNLAILYTKEGENDAAIDCYQQALDILLPEAFPVEALKANQGLGDIYFMQGNWQLAISAYESAMHAVETSRSWATSDSSRQEILSGSISVYENAIQAAVNLGKYQLAIQYTERVRSRQLVELMESKNLYKDAEIPPEIQKYLKEYETLNCQIQSLRERPNDTDSTKGQQQTASHLSRADLEALTHDIATLETQKHALYERIRAQDPVLAGQIAVKPIEWDTIASLLSYSPRNAILTCYSTDDDTHIFILKQGKEPELFTCGGQGKQELQSWLFENWLIPYHTDKKAWQRQIPTILAEISRRLHLDDLVTNYLQDIDELIILPHLYLHQIPFAALPLQAGSEVLGDKFVIRSIPSCQILKYCIDRPSVTAQTYGTVEDADGTLLGARYECQEIAQIHQIDTANRLQGRTQATIGNYRELLTRIERLHSSHHAKSRFDNPLESHLVLADGNITLSDLLLGQRYPDLDEVFLSCCEANLGDVTITDDVATLNTGFLCIGARSVQSTLWAVNDLGTAIFSIFYYQYRKDYNRSKSLQLAQKQLRELTGEELEQKYSDSLGKYLTDCAKAIKDERKELKSKFDRGEIDPSTYQKDDHRLTKNYNNALDLADSLAAYCQADRPFANEFYWAGFVCQGMA